MKPSDRGPTLKGKNLLLEEQVLPLEELDLIGLDGKNKTGRVASPEFVSIHFKFVTVFIRL